MVQDKAPLEEGLALYADTFADAWRKALAQKLGVAVLDQPGDDALVERAVPAAAGARNRLHDFLPQSGDAHDRFAAAGVLLGGFARQAARLAENV